MPVTGSGNETMDNINSSQAEHLEVLNLTTTTPDSGTPTALALEVDSPLQRRLVAAVGELPNLLITFLQRPGTRSRLSLAERSKAAMFQQMAPMALPILVDNLQEMSPSQLAHLSNYIRRMLSGAESTALDDSQYQTLFTDATLELCEVLLDHADSDTPETAAQS